MPQCRRDQRIFAACLFVMVTVETLLIFTVMHLEHESAELAAEQRREERRAAKVQTLTEGSELDTEGNPDMTLDPAAAAAELSWEEHLRVRQEERAGERRAAEVARREKRAVRGGLSHGFHVDSQDADVSLGVMPGVAPPASDLRNDVATQRVWEEYMAESFERARSTLRKDDGSWLLESELREVEPVLVQTTVIKKGQKLMALTKRSVRGKGSRPRHKRTHPRYEAGNLYRDVTSL